MLAADGSVGQQTALFDGHGHWLPANLRAQPVTGIKAVVHGHDVVLIRRPQRVRQLHKPRLWPAELEGREGMEQNAGALGHGGP